MSGEVPYHELYRIAEQAYTHYDEAELRHDCQITAWKYDDDPRKVYNKVHALYRKEFEQALSPY